MKTLVLLAIFLSGAAHAAESVRIRLDAQLWVRPVGAESRLKFRPLGDGVAIDRTLETKGDLKTHTRRIAADEVRATAQFFLVPASAKEPAFVATQVRLFDARTDRLIAECANYDSIRNENTPGVGVCSGVIGDRQFGLTLTKPKR